jgi:hypothetical protein
MDWHMHVQEEDNVCAAVSTVGYYACAAKRPQTRRELRQVAHAFATSALCPPPEDANRAETWVVVEIVPIVVRATGDPARWAVEAQTPTASFACNAAGEVHCI